MSSVEYFLLSSSLSHLTGLFLLLSLPMVFCAGIYVYMAISPTVNKSRDPMIYVLITRYQMPLQGLNKCLLEYSLLAYHSHLGRGSDNYISTKTLENHFIYHLSVPEMQILLLIHFPSFSSCSHSVSTSDC